MGSPILPPSEGGGSRWVRGLRVPLEGIGWPVTGVQVQAVVALYGTVVSQRKYLWTRSMSCPGEACAGGGRHGREGRALGSWGRVGESRHSWSHFLPSRGALLPKALLGWALNLGHCDPHPPTEYK